ncbi:alpha-amylase family glycosyl hydrolase [Roseburia inulinivorans]|uniref:Alpha-amylase n=1 Tax=Roseburia inulinivorans TaxID=360807 RepID=A0A173VXJ9_9FIRM|nr:alpha-amylase family glycosyl hydrolase [Roseburia inulinivorans]CUN30877.1 Alpha-amylase precursor [Roseburia inulinivorans]
MRKLTKSFQKRQSIASRVLCFLLVLAMVVTMVPALGGGNSTVQAAETEKNLTIHFMMPSNWGWTTPAVQFWGGTYAVSGNTNIENTDGTEIPGWGGAKGFFMSKGNVVGDTTEYTLSVKGTFTGFQFLDFANPGNNINPGYDSKLSQYTEDKPTDVYYIQKDGQWDYYLDATGTTSVPDLPKTETTFLLVGNIPGMAWDPSAKPNFVKSSENENIYSITLNAVPAGKYQYKILEDAATKGWDKPWAQNNDNLSLNLNAPADVTLSLDKTDKTKETKVNIAYIKDLVVEVPAQIQKGVTMELPVTGTYYGDDGNVQNGVSVTYTAKTEGITLNGNEILVPLSYEGTEVTVVAAYNGIEKEIIIPVVEVVYHYTIYYYDFDATHMSENASDLWIWQKSGAGATAGTLFTAKEKLSDGNEWLRADVTLPYTDVQIIPRSKDEWKWQGDTVLYNNSATAENVTLYIVSNSNQAYTTLPELVKPKSRSIMIEYDRPAKDYEGWNIYTWNSGFGSDVSVAFADINGKMVAKIPVKDSKADLKLSFCMRHSTAADEWESKDGGDHYVTIPADQSVVKAVFTQGEGITEVLPYNAGYEMDGANDTIHFYYRNDTLAAENNLASLDGKVSVVVNGQTCPMTYDAANDRFGYDLTGVSTGDYYYYYVVDGTGELDAFNSEKADYSGKECSVCHFKKANVSVTASLSQYAMDYNDNNVLSVELTAKDGEGLETSEIAAITANLSELGLGKEFAIEPELMEGTISCLNTVAAGVKNIPVTVKDIYGNVYTTATNVTVTERKKSAGDFDWDEAVIYFAVTDRFFDGDAENNDAYGVGDYNIGEKGGSSYHGGDFAGLNQKLDYLKDLGVNTIWITPIVENITEDQHDNKTDTATYGYHGYWASDFTKLNKHLGTEQQFKALLDAAHSKGMKIMVDVVLNHAGYGTEKYFNSILTDADGNSISMIRDSNNTISGDDKYDSLSDLPDFVTENKAVTDQLVTWQTEWMSKYSIDYYRVDTVKHVETTTWEAFKNSLTKVNPDFKMIGEYSGAGYANNAGELGTGSMDALLDFDFNDFAQKFVTGDISGVESSLQKRNGAINNTATMGSFLSSHDEDSLQYKLVNESKLSEEEAYNLMKVAATLQITAKGQPVLYYGEEIGQGGANNWPLQTNRRDFDWTELEKQKADSNSIYNHYKTMLAIRNTYTDVFARGNRSTVAASDAEGYEVISRSYGNSTLYVGMNVKEAEKEVVIPVAESAGTVLKNLYDGKTYTVSADRNVSVTIPAAKDGGTIVLTAETKTEPAPDNTTDDKKPDGKTTEDHNGNQQTSGNNSSQVNSAVQTTPKQEEQAVAEVTVQEESFANVIEAVNKAKTGSKIRVNLLKTTKIPASVFESIKGKDMNVTFKVSDQASWIINGKDITGNVTAPIDLGLVVGTSDIPKQKVTALADGNETIQLSLNYDGVFGFEGILRLSVGTDYSGKTANLYYYNETTGKFEYYQAVQVKEDGTVDFKFSHASDYVIVLNDTDMSQTTGSVIASPKTSDNTPIAAAVILLLFGCALMGTAYRKNKHF